MKVIKTKEFYTIIIFCAVLALLPSFLKLWMPFDYFSNPSIEKHYLYLVNGDIRAFIIAVPSFLILLGVFIYNFKEKPMIALHLPVYLFMVSRPFLNGSILILNTTNLFQPQISSFGWGTWIEYSKYLQTFFTPYLWISGIIMFSLMIYLGIKIKTLGGVKFEK